jgi:hypothetical protein
MLDKVHLSTQTFWKSVGVIVLKGDVFEAYMGALVYGPLNVVINYAKYKK